MSCPNCYSGDPGQDGGPEHPTEECRHCDPHSVLAIQDAQISALRERLLTIGGMAHDASTGPTVPDTYWEIRRLVEEIL